MKLRLRTRLLAGFLLPFVTTGGIAILVAGWLLREGVAREARRNVELQRHAVRLLYDRAGDEIAYQVRATTMAPGVRELLDAGRTAELAAALEPLRRQAELDFLDLEDASGRVVARAQAPGQSTPGRLGRLLTSSLPAGQTWVAGTVVLSRDELLAESPALAERARVPLLPSPRAEPDGRAEEAGGLILIAAALLPPVEGKGGGVVYGGRLLNRDRRLVNHITTIVSQADPGEEADLSFCTLFLGDVRVATDAVLRNGERAVGTRADRAVRERTLAGGEPHVAKVFVVSEQMLTAYEPLRDLSGKVVGMLAIGMPLRGFAAQANRALGILLGISAVGAVLTLAFSLWLERRITDPIRRVIETSRRIADGDVDQRTRPGTRIVEVAQLGEHFNRMAAAIQERDRQLKQKAEQQIAKSERLGMIGRLAAGVAHEINNPLGGIMLFSNLLLRKVPQDAPERPNLERIASETRRCQKIVQGLLDFARPREPKVEVLSIGEVMEKTLQLLESEGMFHEVEVVREIDADVPQVRADAGQMQEVFLNLTLNALEAMKRKGRLTVAVRPHDQGRAVRVSVTDSGCGIPEDDLEKIFEPFFTTKDVGHGTGLGLSISRGIVETHGGGIWATSKVGQGTTFNVRLPSVVIEQ